MLFTHQLNLLTGEGRLFFCLIYFRSGLLKHRLHLQRHVGESTQLTLIIYLNVSGDTLYEGFMTSTQTSMAGKDLDVPPKTRWADSIKRDLSSSGLDTINAAQMVLDRPQWKAFVSGVPTLEPEQALKSSKLGIRREREIRKE